MKYQWFRKRLVCILPLIAAMLTVVVAGGQTLRADSKADIDRELLEKLGGGPGDDLDRELFAPGKKSSGDKPGKQPAQKADGKQRPGDDIVRELLRELRRTDADDNKDVSPKTDETAAEKGNPLISIARQMRDVERRIGKNDCGQDTQQTQQLIVDQLDRLIEQAKKSCCGGGKPGQKQCKGGTSDRKKVAQAKKPSKSKSAGKGSKSGESSGNAGVEDPAPASRTDMEQMQALIKRLWGELPERDRERMEQYPVEQFLPEYERLIEEYYKRLSEEKDD